MPQFENTLTNTGRLGIRAFTVTSDKGPSNFMLAFVGAGNGSFVDPGTWLAATNWFRPFETSFVLVHFFILWNLLVFESG